MLVTHVIYLFFLSQASFAALNLAMKLVMRDILLVLKTCNRLSNSTLWCSVFSLFFHISGNIFYTSLHAAEAECSVIVDIYTERKSFTHTYAYIFIYENSFRFALTFKIVCRCIMLLLLVYDKVALIVVVSFLFCNSFRTFWHLSRTSNYLYTSLYAHIDDYIHI